MPPVAIVMNMFYTGLGVARSLGEQGISVIGLTSHRGTYGNFTRYAKVRSCPDSREQPEALLHFLLCLGEEIAREGIIFPTRDDDVLFLDRYREELGRCFTLVLPSSTALDACLNKWETYRWAKAVGVPTPQCWSVNGKEDLLGIAGELRYPCVLKPISACHWRKEDNWETVGRRKAICVNSPEELFTEYDNIARAESRALLQEMVPGADDCLWIAACYLDRQSNLVAGFTARKLLQVPEGFGTGCIVQTVDCPELLATAARLLQNIQFSGIAEVEFKWDASCGQHKLIEINARPWDQHRLGKICGNDLIHAAYCDLTGRAVPKPLKPHIGQKWIAEDVFVLLLLRSVWARDRSLRPLLELAHGKRVYGIWSIRDPLPLLGFVVMWFGPELLRAFGRYLWSSIGRIVPGRVWPKKGLRYESPLEKTKCKN